MRIGSGPRCRAGVKIFTWSFTPSRMGIIASRLVYASRGAHAAASASATATVPAAARDRRTSSFVRMGRIL